MKRKRVRNMTPEQVANLIVAIPYALSGQLTSASSRTIRSTFFNYFAADVFESWHRASMDKSMGGADEFGNKWRPITEHTKIYRPLSSAEKRVLPGKKKGVKRGLLTKEENKLWGRIFFFHYRQLSYWLGESEAKAKAAKIAWTVLKKMGARTKLSEYRGRSDSILFNTGRLLNSLKPSSTGGNYYRPRKEQIAEYNGSRITLGTEVPYAANANKDRPLVPSQHNVWAERATAKAIKQLIEELVGQIQ